MFRKGNIGKTIGIIVLIVVLCTGILGVIGSITNGFTDFELRVANEDNLIQVDNYKSTLEDKREDGLSIEVNDDGVIAITGENKTEADVEITICDVVLKADEYTLSANAKGVDDKTYYIKAVDTENDITVTVDSADSETFDVETDGTYSIIIVVCAGEEINTTFKPVLNEGDEAVSFYVLSND